jgi:hypothetical protein
LITKQPQQQPCATPSAPRLPEFRAPPLPGFYPTAVVNNTKAAAAQGKNSRNMGIFTGIFCSEKIFC